MIVCLFIYRVPSKRYPRRLRPLEDDLASEMRRRANTEIKRASSLRDRTRPVGVEVRRMPSPTEVTPRRHSSTREVTPTLYVNGQIKSGNGWILNQWIDGWNMDA